MSFNIFNTCVVWLLFILYFSDHLVSCVKLLTWTKSRGVTVWLEGLRVSSLISGRRAWPHKPGGGRHRQVSLPTLPLTSLTSDSSDFSALHQLALTIYTSLPYPVPTGFSSTKTERWILFSLVSCSVTFSVALCRKQWHVQDSSHCFCDISIIFYFLSFNPLNFIICSLCYHPNYYVSSSHLLKEQFVLNKISALLYMTILTIPGSTFELLSNINLPNVFLYQMILTAVVANL